MSLDHAGEHRFGTVSKEILVLDQIDRLVFDASERESPPRREETATIAPRHQSDRDRFRLGSVGRERFKQQRREFTIQVIGHPTPRIPRVHRTPVARTGRESASDTATPAQVGEGIHHPLEPAATSFADGTIDVDPRLDEQWCRNPDASSEEVRRDREREPATDRIADEHRRAWITARQQHFGDLLGDPIESIASSVAIENRPASVEIEVDRVDGRRRADHSPDMTERRLTVDAWQEDHRGAGLRVDDASPSVPVQHEIRVDGGGAGGESPREIVDVPGGVHQRQWKRMTARRFEARMQSHRSQ